MTLTLVNWGKPQRAGWNYDGKPGGTEELKATDPLRWTGLMNNLRHCAEELVLTDLIYA